MLLLALGSLRALIEALGLCLLAQGALFLLAGQKRNENPMYRFFDFFNRRPCKAIQKLFFSPQPAMWHSYVLLVLYFLLWVGLGWLKLQISRNSL